MKKTFFIFLCFIIPQTTLTHVPRQVWRIIHGTFAKRAQWYQPGGDFYETLKKYLPDDAIVKPFTWSGKNNDEERLNAAHKIISDITVHDHPDDQRFFIAHSHGCNVGMLAIQQLALRELPYKINSFYTLAPPICRNNYQPNMNYLKRLYNFFSFGDRIQPVFQIFHRTYEQHPHIYNIEVTLDDHHPEHGSMHHPALAKLFPFLHEYPLANEQSLIHFYTEKEPHLEIDFEREQKLKDDKRFTEHMVSAIQFIRTYTPQKAVKHYAQECYEYLTQLAPESWNLRTQKKRDIKPEEIAFYKDIEDYLKDRYSIPSLWRTRFPGTKKEEK